MEFEFNSTLKGKIYDSSEVIMWLYDAHSEWSWYYKDYSPWSILNNFIGKRIISTNMVLLETGFDEQMCKSYRKFLFTVIFNEE